MGDVPATKKTNPTELLQNQVELLERISHLEESQQRLLKDVQNMLTRMGADLNDLQDRSEEARDVTISNFNMPFVDLIGFLVKIALASIPAAIVIAIIYAVVFGFLLGGLM